MIDSRVVYPLFSVVISFLTLEGMGTLESSPSRTLSTLYQTRNRYLSQIRSIKIQHGVWTKALCNLNHAGTQKDADIRKLLEIQLAIWTQSLTRVTKELIETVNTISRVHHTILQEGKRLYRELHGTDSPSTYSFL